MRIALLSRATVGGGAIDPNIFTQTCIGLIFEEDPPPPLSWSGSSATEIFVVKELGVHSNRRPSLIKMCSVDSVFYVFG